LSCDHRKRTGDTIDKCYKIHGYPNKPGNRARGAHHQSQGRRAYNTWIENESQDTPSATQTSMLPGLNAEQSKQLFQFLSNMTSLDEQKYNDQVVSGANMAGITPPSVSVAYNSNAICYSCQLDNDCWVLDSGASDHISFDNKALRDLCLLEKPVSVSLPNGYKVQVTHYGKLRLNDYIELNHDLLVPYFKYNLLLVKKLTSQLHYEVVFMRICAPCRALS